MNNLQIYQYNGEYCKFLPVDNVAPYIFNDNKVCVNAKGYQVFDRNSKHSFYKDHAYILVAEYNGRFYGGADWWVGGGDGGGGGSFPSFTSRHSFDNEKDLLLFKIDFLEKMFEGRYKKELEAFRNNLNPVPVQLSIFDLL